MSAADKKKVNGMDAAIAAKADKATTVSGYGITDAYTKNEVNAELGKKANTATTLEGYGISDAYTKTAADAAIKKAVDTAVAGVYKIKGSIALQNCRHQVGWPVMFITSRMTLPLPQHLLRVLVNSARQDLMWFIPLMAGMSWQEHTTSATLS